MLRRVGPFATLLMLPSLSALNPGTVTKGTAHGTGPPMWSAAQATRFLDNVHSAIVLRGTKLARNDKLFLHTTQYLTGTFVPHQDLDDRDKNRVLWSTAMFIENVLTDMNLSGGFWVGSMRFANNDVENLRDHRKEAFVIFERTADYLAGLSKQVGHKQVGHKPAVAFLYVVVKRLGFLKNDPQQAHLLLIGHVQKDGPRHWGVPGGLRDAGDKTSLANAMREFGEEVLGRKSLSSSAVSNLIATANSTGTLSKLTQINNYTAWLLVVDSALHFEMAFGLPKRTVEEKYNSALSRETKGYLYVPLPLKATPDKNGAMTVTAPIALNSRPLVLRKGVLEPSKLI